MPDSPFKPSLDAPALDQLFRQARTYNAFSGDVDDTLLHRLYDLLKFGPTTANTCPARFVFVRSAEAKARLEPALDAGNHDKTMAAPVTVIVAYDLAFYAVNKRGDFGGGSLYPQQYAAHDGRAGALRDTAHLFERPA